MQLGFYSDYACASKLSFDNEFVIINKQNDLIQYTKGNWNQRHST